MPLNLPAPMSTPFISRWTKEMSNIDTGAPERRKNLQPRRLQPLEATVKILIVSSSLPLNYGTDIKVSYIDPPDPLINCENKDESVENDYVIHKVIHQCTEPLMYKRDN